MTAAQFKLTLGVVRGFLSGLDTKLGTDLVDSVLVSLLADRKLSGEITAKVLDQAIATMTQLRARSASRAD